MSPQILSLRSYDLLRLNLICLFFFSFFLQNSSFSLWKCPTVSTSRACFVISRRSLSSHSVFFANLFVTWLKNFLSLLFTLCRKLTLHFLCWLTSSYTILELFSFSPRIIYVVLGCFFVLILCFFLRSYATFLTLFLYYLSIYLF